MKFELKIYSSYEKIKGKFYFAAVNDNVATRYLKVLGKKENKKFSIPEKIRTISLDDQETGWIIRETLKKGEKTIKLGQLETDIAIR